MTSYPDSYERTFFKSRSEQYTNFLPVKTGPYKVVMFCDVMHITGVQAGLKVLFLAMHNYCITNAKEDRNACKLV